MLQADFRFLWAKTLFLDYLSATIVVAAATEAGTQTQTLLRIEAVSARGLPWLLNTDRQAVRSLLNIS